MEEIDDQFWLYAEETPTGFMCSFCSKQYDGSIMRIKWHLAKIEGHDIDICPLVTEDVIKRVQAAHFHATVKQHLGRKRGCISTDLPRGKHISMSKTTTNSDAQNVATNVETIGVHLLATEVLGKQFDECIKDIWSCLMDDDVFRIGIHGIGGVGKTEVAKYINNMLLQNPNKFHHVFWVDMSPNWSICNRPTVSPLCRVRNLQSSISRVVGVDLSIGDGEIKRAAQLSKGLAEKKKSVLILDDVCDFISLQEVGIPVGVDLCTVVFTTRSLQVCRQLGCQRKIEIRCLLPDESYELFKKNLGKETTLSREVEKISRLVADECAGLPLAITIMSRNMKGVTDIRQWRSALRGDTWKKADMEIFQKLKLSYDYLKDTTLQHCFLYCTSLVKEGKYCIGKKMLVEYLVDEGIIKRRNRRREELDEAHTKLNFLADVGLLEITSHKIVKMNALIWSMGLQIMEENNQRSMIKNSESLKDLPDEESWTGDLVRVSLEDNEIKNIPLDFSPSCSKLSMLSLSLNRELGEIGDSFFEGMPGLKVLDLSFTGIQSLPSSICGLVNLTTLILVSCWKLRKFPEVAILRALKKLDLSFSAVKGVAEDIQMPPKLTYLDLFCTEVKLNPRILAQLSHLQFLRLPLESAVKAEELSCLSRLETLICWIYDVVELNKYLVHLKGFKEREPRIQLDVKVGPGATMHGVFGTDLIRDDDDWIAREDDDLSVVVFSDCNINESDMLIYFHQIVIVKCHEARSLCNFSPIKGATKLKHFSIRDCDGLELLCSVPLPGQGILENLEYMELLNLKNLSVLFSKEGNLAYGSCFSNLTRFLIQGCPSIKQLFPIQILPNLKNLQRLYVLDCLSMEEIFAAEEEEEEESSMAEKEKNFRLSRLCIVGLKDLPELKRVCGGRLTFVIPGSCSTEYMNCPKLVDFEQRQPDDDGHTREAAVSSTPMSASEMRILLKGMERRLSNEIEDLGIQIKSAVEDLRIQIKSALAQVIPGSCSMEYTSELPQPDDDGHTREAAGTSTPISVSKTRILLKDMETRLSNKIEDLGIQIKSALAQVIPRSYSMEYTNSPKLVDFVLVDFEQPQPDDDGHTREAAGTFSAPISVSEMRILLKDTETRLLNKIEDLRIQIKSTLEDLRIQMKSALARLSRDPPPPPSPIV